MPDLPTRDALLAALDWLRAGAPAASRTHDAHEAVGTLLRLISALPAHFREYRWPPPVPPPAAPADPATATTGARVRVGTCSVPGCGVETVRFVRSRTLQRQCLKCKAWAWPSPVPPPGAREWHPGDRCSVCRGEGGTDGPPQDETWVTCGHCKGTGKEPPPPGAREDEETKP